MDIIGKSSFWYTSERDISDHILLNHREELKNGDKKGLIQKIHKEYGWNKDLFGREYRVNQVVEELLNGPVGKNALYTSEEDICRYLIAKESSKLHKPFIVDRILKKYEWDNSESIFYASRKNRIQSAIEQAKTFLKMQQCSQIRIDIEQNTFNQGKYSLFKPEELDLFQKYTTLLISKENPKMRISDLSMNDVTRWKNNISKWIKGDNDPNIRSWLESKRQQCNKSLDQSPQSNREENSNSNTVENYIKEQIVAYQLNEDDVQEITQSAQNAIRRELHKDRINLEYKSATYSVPYIVKRDLLGPMPIAFVNGLKIELGKEDPKKSEKNGIPLYRLTLLQSLRNEIQSLALSDNEKKQIEDCAFLAMTQTLRTPLFDFYSSKIIDLNKVMNKYLNLNLVSAEKEENHTEFEGPDRVEFRIRNAQSKPTISVMIKHYINGESMGYDQVEIKARYNIVSEGQNWKIEGPIFNANDFVKYTLKQHEEDEQII